MYMCVLSTNRYFFRNDHTSVEDRVILDHWCSFQCFIPNGKFSTLPSFWMVWAGGLKFPKNFPSTTPVETCSQHPGTLSFIRHTILIPSKSWQKQLAFFACRCVSEFSTNENPSNQGTVWKKKIHQSQNCKCFFCPEKHESFIGGLERLEHSSLF